MKVLLFGKFAKNIELLVKNFGFEIVDKNPDVVISYGGDGTLLSAERQYPQIPKLPIRNSEFAVKCTDHLDEKILKDFQEGKLYLKEYKKLETTVLYKKFYALNDFVIRNSDPRHTIRFKVMSKASHPEQPNRFKGSLMIGDGIVVATPFGSTGYFKSITGQTFEQGFGLCFNNTTEKTPPNIFKNGDSITFKLIRGKATLSFDNSPEIFDVDEGSELVFRLSYQVAKIYQDTSLRCPNCQVIRG